MKNNMKTVVMACFVGVCSMLMFGLNANAYIDPSVMTYMIQVVAGIVVAGGAVAGVYIRKAKKKMTIKCGICDGAYLDQAGVAALANLPSKEVLIAKIMGSMMSSVSKFVYCVEALRKKQAGEE